MNASRGRRATRIGRGQVLGAVGLILLLALIAFAVWANTAAGPMPEAVQALRSDDVVIVETSPWLIFKPANGEPDTGLVLYPGGRVDPRSYAPLARAIAAEGYEVVIVPMPFNLAVLAPDRAGEVMAAFPGVERWAVGGHSLGGSMAARYARSHPERVSGLVLWAAYPDSSDDLSRQDLPAVSVYGTHDGLAEPAEVLGARPLLPAETAFVAVEGGNHAQFGWYGPQANDLDAQISREEQQRQVVEATVTLLQEVAGR